MKHLLLLLAIIGCCSEVFSQTRIIKNIRDFGARGDGITNDHEAFQKAAAFFTARGGYGTLIIPKGKYIIGKQTFGGEKNNPVYAGEDVLHLKNLRHFQLKGELGAILKYTTGLRFGAFDPATGEAYLHNAKPFVNKAYAAFIGKCIFLENCSDVLIQGLEIDGNNDEVILGGLYGDTGFQLAHYGIYILNSRNITVDSVSVHHMALDGISVGNQPAHLPDSIRIQNSRFEYNARQGLSWVGGNQLIATNTSFSYTGRGKFSSSPGGGVDIEAENGPIRNGLFENCEFIHNTGPGMGAASGNSADCVFKNCTFQGTTAAAVFVKKPGFTFENCFFYGTVAPGYSAETPEEATRFLNCHFEDKPYQGVPPFGRFLVEMVEAKKASFSQCTFVTHTMKACWFSGNATFTQADKYVLSNCLFTMHNTNLPNKDFIGITRQVISINTTFLFTNIDGKTVQYNFGDTNPVTNPGSRESKIIYQKVSK